MVVNYNIVNEIFKTLPIGYYLGRSIKCELSATSSCSYFDPARDEIVISYLQIEQAVKSLDIEIDELEEIIRGLLYHEISHVILTPKKLNVNKILNIFEDERIETINKNVFLNTNFKKNVFLLNNYNGEYPENADVAFYHLVRFHKDYSDDSRWIKRLAKLINKYMHINANYDGIECAYYRNNVEDFYRDFVDDWDNIKNSNNTSSNNDDENENENKNENNDNNNSFINDYNNTDDNTDNNNSDSSDSSDDGNNDNDNDNDNASSMTENNQNKGKNNDNDNATTKAANKNNNNNANDDDNDSDNKESNTNNSNKEENVTNDINDYINNDIEDLFNDSTTTLDTFKNTADSIINKYNDNNLKAQLTKIVDRKIKQNKNNGSAINAYSGRFNARSVTRDDYRWWVAQNREGHIKRFSNVHFNLFIDNSGSFWRNDLQMNTFIKALDYVQKNNNNFTFDVITINTDVNEWADHNNIFYSEGGTSLPNSIKDVIKKHTLVNHNNYNIVLFDGNAHQHDQFNHRYNHPDEPFRHFNNNNTIIISDYENEGYIKGSITKARVKYTYNYCDEFISIICDLLEKVI